MVEVQDRLLLEFGHHVVGLQARPGGRGAFRAAHHAGSSLAVESQLTGFLGGEIRIQDHAQIGATDSPVSQKVIDDSLDQSAGDAEPDAGTGS